MLITLITLLIPLCTRALPTVRIPLCTIHPCSSQCSPFIFTLSPSVSSHYLPLLTPLCTLALHTVHPLSSPLSTSASCSPLSFPTVSLSLAHSMVASRSVVVRKQFSNEAGHLFDDDGRTSSPSSSSRSSSSLSLHHYQHC